jgi:hypothetical protein
MKKEWKITIGVAIVLILSCVICLCISSLISFYRTEKEAKIPTCPPLPPNFTESNLVGTWIGNYFGNIDKLIIRADGTYQQIYSGDYVNFESDWHKWNVEYDKDGYVRLHLAGMRRCDGLDSECNDPGGGLPSDSQAVNPCTPEWVTLDDEVILFVTGTTSNVPLGIMLQQAKLAGSDWTYTFRLEK